MREFVSNRVRTGAWEAIEIRKIGVFARCDRDSHSTARHSRLFFVLIDTIIALLTEGVNVHAAFVCAG